MKAIITGISGQDGYFLSQLLLSKGYEVQGILRRNSSMTQGTVQLLPDDVRTQLTLHYGDITDGHFLTKLIEREKPDELYHLAAQIIQRWLQNKALYQEMHLLLRYKCLRYHLY